MAQKILARNVGRPSVDVGEILDVVPDRLMSASATTQLVVKYFREMGATRVFDPERIVLVLDHETPAFSVAGANAHKVVRAFAAEQGIRAFHDLGEGICHQLMIEKGHVRAGSVVLGKDSHSTSYGCAAALGIPVGALEMASVFATGRLWLRVPETIRVVVDGALPPAVFAKDLVLLSAREIRSDGAQYRSIEYLGEGVRGLSMSERFTLANMAVEMGAKCAALPFDEVTRAWALATGDPDPVAIVPDGDAAYVRTVRLDASTLEPMIAVPHNIDSVFPLRERAGTHVDQAFLGSCTNSRLDDLQVAARVVRGRKVHPGTRLVVGAASKDVYVAAMRLGLMADFVEAGAIVIPPGCGPCYGGHQGILGDGEVCISASNRNFRGRMGNANAQVYLASPAAVAAAAVAGEITDPTPFLREGS
jgi:3-isopropylmalate/(R)-2-methylmalate dehydratase large subunit